MVVKFTSLVKRKFKLSFFSFNGICIIAIYLWLKAITIKFDIPRTPKQWYNWNRHLLRSWFKRSKSKLQFWFKYHVLKRPVYYYWSSMDCDLCSSAGYNKADNIYDYLEEEKIFWENVEGRSDMTIITEEEYLENEGNEIESHDYIMEAFENGNGRNVIL